MFQSFYTTQVQSCSIWEVLRGTVTGKYWYTMLLLERGEKPGHSWFMKQSSMYLFLPTGPLLTDGGQAVKAFVTCQI